MDSLGLAEKRNAYYRSLSGGLKQRLSIALALIGNPKVAVLDEMTTGLDPQARRDTWHLIEQVRDRDVTIILVTHYMDEAERLCDRVALLDRGRIVAIDTPEGLAGRAGVDQRVRFVPSKPFDDRLLTGLPGVDSVQHDGEHVIVTGLGRAGQQRDPHPGRSRRDRHRAAPGHREPGGRVRRAHRPPHPRRDREDPPMSTHAVLLPARTPRSAFGKLLQSETKIAWRVPVGLIFGVAVPILLLVIFGCIPAMNKPAASLGGLTYFSVYFPVLIAFVLAMSVTHQPADAPGHLPGAGHLAADVHHTGASRLDARSTGHHQPRPGRRGTRHPGSGGHCGVRPGRPQAAGRVRPGAGADHRRHVRHRAVDLGHRPDRRRRRRSSGSCSCTPCCSPPALYFPQQSMPPVLRQISEWSPLGASVHALQDSMQGTFPSTQSLLILAGWAVLFGFLAVRFFRWE